VSVSDGSEHTYDEDGLFRDSAECGLFLVHFYQCIYANSSNTMVFK
jgi:hypothetical protein